MVEAFGLLEHVFAKHAFVHARCRDRRHVLENAGVNFVRECDRVFRAFDVDRDL